MTDHKGTQVGSFARRIRLLREGARLSRPAIATELGYSPRKIRGYENGTKPPVDFWQKLSKRFGVSLCWLLTGKAEGASNG